MIRFVVGYDRSQISLFPERLDDYLDEEECRAFTLRETSGEGSTAARLDAARVVTFVPVIKGTQTDAEGGSSSRLFAVRHAHHEHLIGFGPSTGARQNRQPSVTIVDLSALVPQLVICSYALPARFDRKVKRDP